MPRGFAAMPEEKRKEIAAAGGKLAHENGTAHEWTPEEAAEAGRIGGQAIFNRIGVEGMREMGSKGGAKISQNREHMAEIGRRGGSRNSRERMVELGRISAAKRKAKREQSEP